jgi:hypothetical protein
LIDRYFTPDTIRLVFLAVVAAAATGVAWRTFGRERWGGSSYVVAFVVGTGLADRSDWPRWDGIAVVGVLLTLLACIGSSALLADSRVSWRWNTAGALISAVGVWAAVPETGPAVLAAGCLIGLAAMAAATGSELSPSAGAGMAAILGWAALTGAVGRPWATIGGVLCTGAAPWFAFMPLLSVAERRRQLGLWFLCAHAGLAALAARWIAADPHAGWTRAGTLAAAGVVLAAFTRLRPTGRDIT